MAKEFPNIMDITQASQYLQLNPKSLSDLQELYKATNRPIYRVLAKGLAADSLNLNF